MEKKCSKCGVVKDVIQFHKHLNGYRSECKECRKNGGNFSSRVDRSNDDENNKTCTKCLKLQTIKNYSKNSWCNTCKKDYEQARRISKGIKVKPKPIVNIDTKECLDCKEILHIDKFRNNPRGRLMKSAYCIVCEKKRQQARHKAKPEEGRAATKRYRDSNREWWRALHRKNQFNRRNKIKALEDGTITKEFITNLYKIENCYYCNKVTPTESRTCEHVVPLNKGGVHGISNLKMACLSCNSKKRDMTEEEFKNYNNV
jgi:hypothetical protein